MSLNSNKIFFSQLVSASSNTSFRVPDFQRDFVWKRVGEVEEFWQDIEEQFEDTKEHVSSSESGLFLGNLILCNPDDETNTFQIIDGQQRITTIFILLIAFRSFLDDLNFDSKKKEITRVINNIDEILVFHDLHSGESIGSRFSAAKSVNDILSYMSKPNWERDFPPKIGKKAIKRQTNKVKPIYDYFSLKIKNTVSLQNYHYFFQTINTLTFIKITLVDYQEAYLFFERTNARGKNLEVGDLLKAHLFANHPDHKEIADIWDQIVTKSSNLLTRMLKYFYITEKGHITASKLFNGLKKLYEEEEKKEDRVLKLVFNLEDFADFFAALNKIEDQNKLLPIFDRLSNEKKSLDAVRLNKIYNAIDGLNLFGVTQATPLIWSVLKKFYALNLDQNEQHKKEDTLVRFFETLENYHFINNYILDRVGNEVEKLYASYASDFSRVDTAYSFKDTLKDLFMTLKDQLAPQKTFVAEFSDLEYSETRNNINLYYIFDRFENVDIKNAKLSPSDRNTIFHQYKAVKKTDIDIEHWYPRSQAKDSDNEVLPWCQNIGNLMAISSKTNKMLGKKMPQEKYEFLKKNKEYISFNHVNRLLDDYGPSFENWDEARISERAKKMADNAYNNIWKFDPPFLDLK
jgi:uncharacterized protein with ParB-like and HNH nuclease domain